MSSVAIRKSTRRAFMKTMGAAHNGLYRLSGGRIGGRVQGMSVLLLTTKGRKSGKLRTSPLLYLRDGDDIVVVASNGGSSYTPAWWLNLQSHPDAEIELGRERSRVTGRVASPEERARLWPEFTSGYAGYASYATRTKREIPVVILEPVHGGGNPAPSATGGDTNGASVDGPILDP